MKLTEDDIQCEGLTCGFQLIISPQNEEADLSEELKKQILKNQENISPDKVVEYVLENHYDEVKEAVFEQEAESQRE